MEEKKYKCGKEAEQKLFFFSSFFGYAKKNKF